MPVDKVRDAAIDVLLRVFERDAYLDLALDRTLRRRNPGDRGRRFMTQLVYGTVRHRRLCDHILQDLCNQPLSDLPPAIHAIMRMAVFQALFCNQVTRPAMVHTSVELAKRRGHAGLARLTNAVLRRVPDTLDLVALPARGDDLQAHLGIRYSIPDWLAGLWISELGEEKATQLCEASSKQAPHSLRVNTLKTTAEELAKRLEKAGVAVGSATELPEELRVLSGPPPTRTKWFQQGHFMLQDPASMLPARLLEPRPGEQVLDLCAAPGGKTTHLAALAEGRAAIIALDRKTFRLAALQDNVERLGTPGIYAVAGDGAQPPLREGFDAVLVDAPCSGLGTLRRHPDLKWRMTPKAVARLGAEQEALLRTAIRLCKNGGRIVYSVCTVTQRETQDVVAAVLEAGVAAPENGPESLDQWQIGQGQYQILPSGEAWDGFFLTRFRKAS